MKTSCLSKDRLPLMSNEISAKTISCPYCSEHIDILVDGSLPNQEYVEDCQECCRPILLSVTIAVAGDAAVVARSENE